MCEYYLTPETYHEFMEIMKMDPDKRPGALRIKIYKRPKPNAKQKKLGAETLENSESDKPEGLGPAKATDEPNG
jgi:hypothetical protein